MQKYNSVRQLRPCITQFTHKQLSLIICPWQVLSMPSKGSVDICKAFGYLGQCESAMLNSSNAVLGCGRSSSGVNGGNWGTDTCSCLGSVKGLILADNRDRVGKVWLYFVFKFYKFAAISTIKKKIGFRGILYTLKIDR